ncbi:hypothetical protein GIB67_007333 [Kingdonia uniflora]|uniref:Uncharacterized protein n=1 Tax=Kingdonia uniflora TaxID=39325 RepID=A0A7J7NXW1_9MAGN|nr:hypothetical protein GIB67_007333 [Kingdonia uniflora]
MILGKMKFGKEYTSQMVHEWQDAYVNYKYLKSLLKEMIDFLAKLPHGIRRTESISRAFSGISGKAHHLKIDDEEEEQVILARVDSNGRHLTTFLMVSDEGGEYELFFFRRLDDELNKVIVFYKSKMEEVFMEAEEIDKQMDALIALRLKVLRPEEATRLASAGMKSQRVHCKDMEHTVDVITEVEISSDESSEDDDDVTPDKTERKKINFKNSTTPQLHVLKHVKINIKLETPLSTLKGIITDSKPKNLTFSNKELRGVEEQLKVVLIEYYQKLRLLKSYNHLNLLAFSKIMKKYDKITSRNASRAYLKMVNNSYIGNSDEVNRMMERVEKTFIRHFANANRSKGIQALRPRAKRKRHIITFSSGFLAGCSVALLAAIVVLIQARNLFHSRETDRYMENIFPLYSLFGYVVLHMLMYSANVYFWKRYRINYPFIFGFKQGSSLGYREVFLLSASLSVIALGGVLSNLDMEMDPSTESYEALTELVPLVLVIAVLLIVFCPLNIIYRSSRFFLIRCAFRSICAPLYKVSLVDMILADQLTSQSLRLCIEESSSFWGYNALKYFSIIIAVIMRTGYELHKKNVWLAMAVVSSAVAGIYSTYWDLVNDWGLLQRNSKNRWLRDKLLLPYKSIYYAAMILNVILRFAWLQTVLGITNLPHMHKNALTALIACLEILRRGIWNFFRMESVHLNNMGKYRAFKAVPLPLNYDYIDEDAEKKGAHSTTNT